MMKNTKRADPRLRQFERKSIGVGVAAFIALASASAAEIDTGSDLKLRWDNTVKYSIGSRLSNANATNLANVQIDDADRNFSKNSLITNRVDLLSEIDARIGGFGLSISGAAWYDNVYNKSNDNNSPATFNPYSVANNQFTSDVKKLAGRHAEIRNAFVMGQFNPGDSSLTVRAGRHVVLWGESLFFSDNGVAAAMAPVDAYSALGVPSLQAKEVFMPVNQLSGTAVLSDSVTLEGFYQFESRRTRIPPAGTFFSGVDLLDIGGERLIAGPGVYFYRDSDAKPKKKQFGASLKWRPENLGTDFGFYAIRYNDKVPQVYVTPGVAPDGTVFNPAVVNFARGQIGTYQLSYKEGIQLYGTSVNTTFGDANVGAELSYRRGIPLVSNAPALMPGMAIDNGNPLYAVGDTVHFQASTIWVGKKGPFYDGISFAGEIGGHHLVKVTANDAARDTTRDKTALGMRGVATFEYAQVAPGWDLSVPVTVGWNFKGKSPISAAFNTYGSHHGGDLSLGLLAVYRQSIRTALNVTRFTGKEVDNVYRDRSFVTLNVSTSF